MPEDSAQLFDGVPELAETSESEQMYLITAARAEEDGLEGQMPVGDLAVALGVTVTSANEMVRKLAAKGLLDYEPYRGVALTDGGRRIAGRVLRTRRLWSTFLAEHLDFSATEADDLACHLEHVTPADAAERLAAFLGDPVTGPLGKPIPSRSGESPAPGDLTLADATIGTPLEVTRITTSEAVRSFLASEGIRPGAVATVQAGGASGVLVEVDGRATHVSIDIASDVVVRSTREG